MQYTARRGFYLVLPTLDEPQPSSSTSYSDTTAGGLPHGFLKLDAGRARSGIPCTTHELTALNARLRDAADDCLALTEQVLWPLTLEFRTMDATEKCLALTQAGASGPTASLSNTTQRTLHSACISTLHHCILTSGQQPTLAQTAPTSCEAGPGRRGRRGSASHGHAAPAY